MNRSGRLPFGGLNDKSINGIQYEPATSFNYGSDRERNRPDPADGNHRSGRLPFGGLTDKIRNGSSINQEPF